MSVENFLDDILENVVKEIQQDEDAPTNSSSIVEPLLPKYFSMSYSRHFWENYPLFTPFGSTPAKFLLLNTPIFIPKVRILLLGEINR